MATATYYCPKDADLPIARPFSVTEWITSDGLGDYGNCLANADSLDIYATSSPNQVCESFVDDSAIPLDATINSVTVHCIHRWEELTTPPPVTIKCRFGVYNYSLGLTMSQYDQNTSSWWNTLTSANDVEYTKTLATDITTSVAWTRAGFFARAFSICLNGAVEGGADYNYRVNQFYVVVDYTPGTPTIPNPPSSLTATPV